MPDDQNVSDARQALEDSIAKLEEAEAEVERRRRAVPRPSFKEDGLLLKRAARFQSELTAQRLLLNHLNATAVHVDPPTADSGKALAAALAALVEMKRQTTALARCLDLAAAVATEMANHRNEVDDRATG